MAGLSSRFTKAGYDKPKYMLDIDKHSVFYHAVNSFNQYFEACKILFIYRDIQGTKEFINSECLKMGVTDYDCIELTSPTEGQAHTVYLGIEDANIDEDENILIFNIDTFRPNFKLPKELDFNTLDGYLEVFEADGENWSFVLPKGNETNEVKETAEKNRISSLCSSGLYYFTQCHEFKRIFKEIQINNDRSKDEFYIAPMYNYLIRRGMDIRYSKITLDKIVFCGTPDEYMKLIR